MNYKGVKIMYSTVADFLNECHNLIKEGKVDLFLNDPDNRRTMEILGYNPEALLQEILELESKHLYKGPKMDKDSRYPGEIWEFKKEVQSILLYIKLKIRVRNGKDVFLMSFHPDN